MCPENLVQNLRYTRFLPSHKNKTFLTMCTSTASVIVKTHLQGVHCSAYFIIISKDQSLYTQSILQLTLGMISYHIISYQQWWKTENICRSSMAISWALTGRIRRERERQIPRLVIMSLDWDILLLLLLLLFTFMQGICNCIPEANYVPQVYSFAAILYL